MPLDVITLSKYRLERAKEDLKAAQSNHEAGLFKASINRSYYAIFHSIRAVVILDGYDSSKHSGIISQFNKCYVHTGEFDKNTYKIIDSAYRIREKCDYQDFFIASKSDSALQLERAQKFIETVEQYLSSKYI